MHDYFARKARIIEMWPKPTVAQSTAEGDVQRPTTTILLRSCFPLSGQLGVWLKKQLKHPLLELLVRGGGRTRSRQSSALLSLDPVLRVEKREPEKEKV